MMKGPAITNEKTAGGQTKLHAVSMAIMIMELIIKSFLMSVDLENKKAM